MRKLVKIAILGLGLFVAYVAWPFLSAYQIRQAVRGGDTTILAQKIEFPAVRASLKQSLAELAAAKAEADYAAGTPRPGMIARFKAWMTPSVVDRIVDQWVTPQGLPQAYNARDTWRNTVRPNLPVEPAPPLFAEASLDASPFERFAAFWRRVQRAAFLSMTEVEIEVADRFVPERRYIGRMELKGLDWKLTSLKVAGTGF
jgi:Protein of unknown function (DUF2939)